MHPTRTPPSTSRSAHMFQVGSAMDDEMPAPLPRTPSYIQQQQQHLYNTTTTPSHAHTRVTTHHINTNHSNGVTHASILSAAVNTSSHWRPSVPITTHYDHTLNNTQGTHMHTSTTHVATINTPPTPTTYAAPTASSSPTVSSSSSSLPPLHTLMHEIDAVMNDTSRQHQ